MAKPQTDVSQLTGKFAHYCWDWDGMEIDETCHEFTCCTCHFDDETGRREAVAKLDSMCPRCGNDVDNLHPCKCWGDLAGPDLPKFEP